MKVELELDIPAELIDADFERHLKEDVVLRLFADRKIPAGRAARLLELERTDFLDLLRQRGIPAVDYTVDDWESDGTGIAGLAELSQCASVDELMKRSGMHQGESEAIVLAQELAGPYTVGG